MQPQQGFTIWLTGMSGAGKSAIARTIAPRIQLIGRPVEILDVDDSAELLPADAEESREGRELTVRRLGHVAKVLTRNGVVTIVAATSPYRESRDAQRKAIGRFVEVFVDCAFDRLVERDTRGLYRRALAGEIQNMTGVQDPYEPPGTPDIVVNTTVEPVEQSAARIYNRLQELGYVSRKEHEILAGPKPARLPKAPPALEPPARAVAARAKGSKVVPAPIKVSSPPPRAAAKVSAPVPAPAKVAPPPARAAKVSAPPPRAAAKAARPAAKPVQHKPVRAAAKAVRAGKDRKTARR